MSSGYIISEDDKQRRYIECLSCHLRSYNFYDILNRYCGNCHSFHDDILLDSFIDEVTEQ